MTIYVGCVEGVTGGNAWIKPLASGYVGDYGWKNEVFENEFPERGNAYFSKNYNDEIHNDTIWIFEIEENPRYEPTERGTKYNAINQRVAYVVLDLSDFKDPLELRKALLSGFSIAYVPAAKKLHWLFRTADGRAVYFSPERLSFEPQVDSRLTVKLNQSLLDNQFDVEIYDLSDIPSRNVRSEYFDPIWLPKNKEIHCWESDVRFMERIVNRVRKLKRKFNDAGMTMSQPFEITKAKASEALELLKWAGSLTDTTDLDRGMLERLSCVFEKLDKDQLLLNELFSLVYDNETLNHYLQLKEKEHIDRRYDEIENRFSEEHLKLEKAAESLNKLIEEHNLVRQEIEDAQSSLEKCQKEAAQELHDRKGTLELGFTLFKEDLQIQAHAVTEQFSSKLAELLMQNQLLQLLSGTSLMPHQPNILHTINTPTVPLIEVIQADIGINNVQEWKTLLNKCSNAYCIDKEALLLADVVCRSREIPMLFGKPSSWLLQCYGSLFGTKRVLRYTPGPTTLGLDDLFYRGGTDARTQLQLFIEKAAQAPSLVHLVMLEQIYCEQAHFWLPSLAREMRLGTRIPENVLILISENSDIERLEETVKEVIWPIECHPVSVSKSGIVLDPKSQSDKSRGLDLSLISPGMPYILSDDPAFITFQTRLRNTHENNAEMWNRFSRLMSTAKDLDDQSFTQIGEQLIYHIQKTN
ncbi:hypothetical protein [Photobacterium phosphoreum]|uniref:hypothetical protein n=1 Tax=Photobacterium phosphoreum TaxID=659 RepID=UPI001E5EF4A9|nr:hypothetical protein [Photobacterium phosphoreum]MCD9472645.1 hypothetical protein [Photobacterium phosphoreum]MCD9504030.1 hypothetical protein [Photobacterium phosphoreum]